MKLKFYLRGLGVGLLVTTLMLRVDNNIKESQSILAENSSTSASVLNSSKAETKAANIEQTTASQTETVPETNAEIVTEAQNQTSIEKVTETSTIQNNEKVVETNQPITVVLSNILYSERAAHAIADAGVVSDWNDFNDYLVSSGYAVKIHNGTYTLYKGQDYESIAKIITGK